MVPMPTGEPPFEEIEIEFIGELPQSEGFDAILVITDWFTKAQQYVPAKTKWTAANVDNVYINKICRLYGLLRHIISHCGPQFAPKFLKEVNKKLGIILHLSTAYHPQTDGLHE